MTPLALLINLEQAPERLRLQTRQLQALGVPFERIAAVEANSIPDDQYRSWMYQWERPLAKNEIACLLSHQRAWREIVRRGESMVVLEDDCVLSENLADFLGALEVPAEQPLAFNLESSFDRKLISREYWGKQVANYALRRVIYDRGGSAAYILNPAAAELAIHRSEVSVAPADALLNHLDRVRRYQVEPTLAMQLHCFSTLGATVEARAAARSFNARPGRDERQLKVWLRHPGMKFRRMRTELGKGLARLRKTKSASLIRVSPCPTLQRQFERLAVRAA